MLTRENIRSGLIQRMIREGDTGMRILTEPELRASLDATMREATAGGDVWVFGYGSLIWNPAFHHAEKRIGLIHGYHRRFCLWTQLGRGSPDRPGLTLGLERGGRCRGAVFRIAADKVDSELEIVWRREMVSGAYRPCWVDVRTGDAQGGNGRMGPETVRAITFAINRDHERYAGRLSDETVVETIASASGALGPCSDYLFNTVAHLDELNIRDRRLERLCDLVAKKER